MAVSWKVSAPQMTTGAGGRHGFGIGILNHHNSPLLSAIYETEAEAKKAEELLREALENAVDVSGR